MDDAERLELARVRVRAHKRVTKKGNVVDVDAHMRRLAKMLAGELTEALSKSTDRTEKALITREIAARKRRGEWEPPNPSVAHTASEASRLNFVGRLKELTDLRDGKGPVERWLRDKFKKAGLDPYALDWGKLDAHATEHAEAKGVAGNRKGESRFWFKSPCWLHRDVDFAVHQCLPVMVAGKRPELAKKLISTSPRWKDTSLDDLLDKARPQVALSRLLFRYFG